MGRSTSIGTYDNSTLDGKGGVVKRDLALFNNGGDMGGNWGWMMKNTTDHSIFVEVGTYAATGQTFADGTDVEDVTCVPPLEAVYHPLKV